MLIINLENQNNYSSRFSQILEEMGKSVGKELGLRNDIKLGAVNIDIAEKDIELAKGTLQPTLRAFYSYSNRIGYST